MDLGLYLDTINNIGIIRLFLATNRSHNKGQTQYHHDRTSIPLDGTDFTAF